MTQLLLLDPNWAQASGTLPHLGLLRTFGHIPKNIPGWWLSLALWKIWKSVGIMKFPTEWKNKIHVPNYQPVVMRASLTPLVRWFNIPSFKIIAVVSQPSFGWWKNPILVGSQSAVSVWINPRIWTPRPKPSSTTFFLLVLGNEGMTNNNYQ